MHWICEGKWKFFFVRVAKYGCIRDDNLLSSIRDYQPSTFTWSRAGHHSSPKVRRIRVAMHQIAKVHGVESQLVRCADIIHADVELVADTFTLCFTLIPRC